MRWMPDQMGKRMWDARPFQPWCVGVCVCGCVCAYVCVVDALKKTRRVAGGVIWRIMITRGDVQRVMDAFILEETLYWWLHPIERVQTVRGMDAWDGYHWTLGRQMAQDEDSVSLKAYMDTLGETYCTTTLMVILSCE